jgi:predicted transposase YbfD/YdcC
MGRQTKIADIMIEEGADYILTVKENQVLLEPDAKEIAFEVSVHRGIENSLHWALDVSFEEDRSMKRNQNAIEKFSIINRTTLNLVKKETTKKGLLKENASMLVGIMTIC